jgi:hypothetical protein
MSTIIDGSAGITFPNSTVQAQATAKASALAKLTVLGLSEDEVKALVG